MGTRADFYVGRGPDAEWLGSIAWDGYPDGLDDELLGAMNEDLYRTLVADLIDEREDGTKPEQGWPWPWDNSSSTDYAYAFHEHAVWASEFGHVWFPATRDPDEYPGLGPDPVFPDMAGRKNVARGDRSGLITVERVGNAYRLS